MNLLFFFFHLQKNTMEPFCWVTMAHTYSRWYKGPALPFPNFTCHCKTAGVVFPHFFSGPRSFCSPCPMSRDFWCQKLETANSSIFLCLSQGRWLIGRDRGKSRWQWCWGHGNEVREKSWGYARVGQGVRTEITLMNHMAATFKQMLHDFSKSLSNPVNFSAALQLCLFLYHSHSPHMASSNWHVLLVQDKYQVSRI